MMRCKCVRACVKCAMFVHAPGACVLMCVRYNEWGTHLSVHPRVYDECVHWQMADVHAMMCAVAHVCVG